MPMHVALLRAVNLAGRNKVAMADLRTLATGLGFEDVRTLLASGNLLFRSGGRASSELEALLQDAAREELGVDTEFFVRTADEWSAAVARNPFPDEARSDPGRLLLMALKDAPGPAAVDALQESIEGRELVRAAGRQAYVFYPDGIGRSRLTTAVIEKGLGTRATGRNWNTVLKLAALTES